MKKMPAALDGFSIDRFRTGDSAMLKKVYDAFSGTLHMFSSGMLQEGDAAEDMVLESMVKLWKNREKMQSEEHVYNFLFKVIRNACKDEISRKKRKNKVEIHFSELFHDDRTELDIAEGELTYSQMIRMVQEQLEALPSKQKVILHLWHKEDKSVNEISAVMGVAGSTVYNQMRASFRKIREKLKAIR